MGSAYHEGPIERRLSRRHRQIYVVGAGSGEIERLARIHWVDRQWDAATSRE